METKYIKDTTLIFHLYIVINLPNLLLIARTGRKSGKTTLACAVIKKFSSLLPITGLKISPHFHDSNININAIYKNAHYKIYRETSVTSGKDSSLMLAAGAEKVFYIETTDRFLSIAFQEFMKLVTPVSPIVCESPGLRNVLHPGLFLILKGEITHQSKKNVLELMHLADHVIDLKSTINDRFLSEIIYENAKWMIRSN
jgi:hypothetical protein